MIEKKEVVVAPLIITRGLVTFPGCPATIEAARTPTLAALELTKDFDNNILVVSQIDPTIDNPTKDDIYMVGTFCRVISVTPLKDYTRVRVDPRFRVKLTLVASYEKDNPDSSFIASYEEIKDILGDRTEEEALIRSIINELEQMSDVLDTLPKSFINQLSKGVSSIHLTNLLGYNMPLSIKEKQDILETDNVNDRLEMLLKAINKEKAIREVDRTITNRIKESTEKTQREYILREKLKAIRTELGEDEDASDSESKILERLENNPYPENIKAKVKSEFKRYQMMPSASLESSIIRNYIDTLMDLPWYQSTTDNDDLKHAREILDEDHYGLDKVKDRIIEYLAVKKMTGNLKAPILCLYGAPGVGKTSLGRSIARALNRKFHKVALGGISDEAEIRGHRRTYVGAMPGRIIAGMRKVGVNNPVYLLDEVDKLANSYKGDPASALLEVLDPEQNIMFNDNYVEEPFDLSNVLFIATANNIENIPAPLRDRLELIEVSSYTVVEKLHIAKEHLIPKQIALAGLKPENIKFDDKAILAIIYNYTREAGVRELERKIAGICRKVVVSIVNNPDIKKVHVTEKKVKEFLGIELFTDEKKEKKDQVGVVTGLAYTQYGGSILPIEVTNYVGKGRLVLTGSLGDVMKESASIALDYIRANAQKYHIDNDVFEKNDIHIHFPEGAIPKDGPSAGVAITTAIISSLTNRKVNKDVAMTGEVSLRGNAIAIGGLREKSLAALRSGIKTIIVPLDNKPNVEELPKEVKEKMEIVYMTCVDDALKFALRGTND
ncbi:MAG: endopeptidase La [Erysipelotrichaceae bacterium]|nr:endopeptidase La [Erysipelotrichaceae bacterium]